MNIEHFMYIRVQRFSFSFLSLDIDGKKQMAMGKWMLLVCRIKKCVFLFYPQNPSALIFKKKQQRNKLLLIQNKAKRAIIWPPQLQTCSGHVLPGMPCWRLWRQFDVILPSSCRCDDVNLMSKFLSNFTSILMLTKKIDVTSIILPKFDVILSSSCRRDDVNLMSKLTSNLTSILMSNVNKNIDDTSIIWPKFDAIWSSSCRQDDINLMSKLMSNLTSILMSNVNENIDVTSIIWPKFDIILTSKCWWKVLTFDVKFYNILMKILKSIWHHCHVNLMSMSTLFINVLTSNDVNINMPYSKYIFGNQVYYSLD